MMPEDDFWSLVQQAHDAAKAKGPAHGDALLEAQMETLQSLLMALPAAQIIDYQNRFSELSQRLYRWDLWGAAYWMHGGCGNDGFTDFRATLISLGKQRFYKTLENADSLAELIGRQDSPYLQGEGFQYVASQAYCAKTGESQMPMPWDVDATGPEGEKWDFDDKQETAERLPKLVARLPEMGD
jgi:hypothetical protein